MNSKSLVFNFFDSSERCRNGYKNSIGFKPAADRLLPEFIKSSGLDVIYEFVEGTPHNIENQALMDFIPGFRLLPIEEISDRIQELQSRGHGLIPFLANYSNDFLCVQEGRVISVFHDDVELVEYSASIHEFLETINAMYGENVFFISDGYLDYDFEKELVVGAKLNPSSSYWME